MCKAKPFLDKDSLTVAVFFLHSFIHKLCQFSMGDKTDLKKIHSQQKHALRIVYNKDRYYHTKKFFRAYLQRIKCL